MSTPPAFFRAAFLRFMYLFRKQKLDRELSAELESHLQLHIEDNVNAGMSPAAARREALLKLGGLAVTKENYRDQRGFPFIESVIQDLRFALRMLSKSLPFTVASVLATALGVGLNVGIFSVLNGATLRLLPIPRAEQVVSVNQIFHRRTIRNTHGETSMFSYAEYVDYRDQNHVFTGLAAYEPFLEATLAGGKTRQLLGAATSCNYFDVLSEHPAQGRGFCE